MPYTYTAVHDQPTGATWYAVHLADRIASEADARRIVRALNAMEVKHSMSNEDRITRLEHVVGTLITWLPRELGRDAVQELIDMLVSPPPKAEARP